MLKNLIIEKLKWTFKIGWKLTRVYAGCCSWHIVKLYERESGEYKCQTEDTKHLTPGEVQDYIRKIKRKNQI